MIDLYKTINEYKTTQNRLIYEIEKTIASLISPFIPFNINFIKYLDNDLIYFEIELPSVGFSDIDIENIEKLGFIMIDETREYHKPHTYLFREAKMYDRQN